MRSSDIFGKAKSVGRLLQVTGAADEKSPTIVWEQGILSDTIWKSIKFGVPFDDVQTLAVSRSQWYYFVSECVFDMELTKF